MRVVESSIGGVGQGLRHAPGGRAEGLVALVSFGVVPAEVACKKIPEGIRVDTWIPEGACGTCRLRCSHNRSGL